MLCPLLIQFVFLTFANCIQLVYYIEFFLSCIKHKKDHILHILLQHCFPPYSSSETSSTGKQKHLLALYLLATQNSTANGQLYLKTQNKSRTKKKKTHILLSCEQWNIGYWLIFPVIKG